MEIENHSNSECTTKADDLDKAEVTFQKVIANQLQQLVANGFTQRDALKILLRRISPNQNVSGKLFTIHFFSFLDVHSNILIKQYALLR